MVRTAFSRVVERPNRLTVSLEHFTFDCHFTLFEQRSELCSDVPWDVSNLDVVDV